MACFAVIFTPPVGQRHFVLPGWGLGVGLSHLITPQLSRNPDDGEAMVRKRAKEPTRKRRWWWCLYTGRQ